MNEELNERLTNEDVDEKFAVEAVELADIDTLEEDITPGCCCGFGCTC